MKKNFSISTCLVYIILALMTFTFIFPFWRILAISFNEGIDAMAGGIYFWPRKFTLDNFLVIFSKPDIINAYKVTTARTFIGTVLSLVLMSLMAYGLSKDYLPGKRFFNIMILITMFFSGGMIPFYLLLKQLSLLNRFWVYIIPMLYQAWNIILFRTFFKSLPASLEESAKIDGANDVSIFFRIIFPIALPIFATIALFVAVTHWNDWFIGEFYVQNKKLLPLQTLLMRIIQENESSRLITDSASQLSSEKVKSVTSYSVKMSTLIVTVLPIICVYPFLQKYFIKGIMVGSIKG